MTDISFPLRLLFSFSGAVTPAQKAEEAAKGKEAASPSSSQNEETQAKVIPTPIKNPCPSYAVIYDEAIKDIQLVNWTTYEKKYLPQFMAERDKFLKAIKQADPSKPAEPMKQAEPSKPVKPMKKAKPSKPVEPTKQAEPVVADESKKMVSGHVESHDLKVQPIASMHVVTFEHKEESVPSGPLTTIYDPENQYVSLISWSDYEAHHLQHDMAQWNRIKVSQRLVSTPQSQKKTPVAPMVAIYDEASQAVKLISWEEYVQDFQALDMAQWQKKNVTIQRPVAPEVQALIALPVQESMPQIAITPIEVYEVKQKCEPQVAIYDETSQMVKLISWDEYESHHLPQFLAVRNERELMRFHAHQQSKNKVQEAEGKKEEKCKSFVADYDDQKQEVCLRDFESYKPSYKQDYATVYNPTTQSIDLIFWSDYLKNYEPQYRAEWGQMVRKPNESAVSTPTIVCNQIAVSVPTAVSTPVASNLTTVYDPCTEGVKLVSLDEYQKVNKLPKQDWSAEYDESNQSVKLVFWKQYQPQEVPSMEVVSSMDKASLSTKEPISEDKQPVPELTTLYDEVTQGIKLVDWNEYLSSNKLPKQDWMAEYDEVTQSVKLVFWKQYVADAVPEVPPIKIHEKSKALPDMTTVYDPDTQEIKLIPMDKYLQHQKIPQQDWTTEYDATTQSVKLAFWKPFQKVNPTDAASIVSTKQQLGDLTTVYDEASQEVKLITMEEYLKTNKPPKQDWSLEYDETTQSLRLAFWKPYQAPKEESSISTTQSPIGNLTTEYDPTSESVKLVSLEESWCNNKQPKQDWSVEYDETTQSVKQYQKKTMADATPVAVASQKPQDFTTVYDPSTQGVRLISLEECHQKNKLPKQDWMAEYDEKIQSVKLVFWKQYIPVSTVKACQQMEKCPLSYTTVYDPSTAAVSYTASTMEPVEPGFQDPSLGGPRPYFAHP